MAPPLPVSGRIAPAYRGRFAPSPTGAIHVGTASSALLGWLRARSAGGAFVLRIEDLDAPRVRPGATGALLADLRWLGLDWDEGPDVGGAFGPYTQSERLGRYESAVSTLEVGGHLYPCTCSRREIQAVASAPHGDEGHVYPGTCREGPTRPERTAALRLRMPEPPPGFVDAILGPSRPGMGRGDFVVRRRDGVFAYQLAVVVDDAAMGITEVVRGVDILPSTPRQLALYDALGWSRPAFAHLPLVVGADGERLAKRKKSLAVAALRAEGWTAEQLVGRLAFGSGLIDRDEPVWPAELVDGFDLGAIAREPLRWSC